MTACDCNNLRIEACVCLKSACAIYACAFLRTRLKITDIRSRPSFVVVVYEEDKPNFNSVAKLIEAPG